MINFLSKVFGTKHEKDVKIIKPLVDQINKFYDEFDSLSDDELRSKTAEFKKYIKDETAELEQEKINIIDKLRNEALDADQIADLNARLNEIENELHKEIQSILDEILPEAYAVVKQTCKRLSDQRYTYDYAGDSYTWDMVPYDVQLIGGVVLHQGKIAEMATGEGKTLVAVMPLYLNSLAGKGSHLVTVNDYLAKRDADWMSPVYKFHGLTVGVIQSNMEHDDRKSNYNCDITYGTNNEFGFDYLRDNMVIEAEQMVQREHWYAIVDEVDSVLVDEARTPLIISGPVGAMDQKFDEMNPRVKRLVESQMKLVTRIVNEAEELLAKNTKEDKEQAGINILRATRGFPKHKKLRKLMQDPENQKLLRETELFFLRDQGRKMHEIDAELFYTIDEKNHNIDIQENGRELMATAQEEADMFVIPDITTQISMIEGNSTLSEEEKTLQKDESYRLYAERSDRIHTVSQLLRAYSLYEKDVEYVIQDSKIMIVDEHTGRILEGRRYSEGLHQAIEAKEGVKVERDTQTLATITLQNYFRMYKKLAGMTGTAETEASEFEKIYKLDCVVIPTNKPITRRDQDDLVYKTTREKFNAVIDAVETVLAEGRAVLVGTASVEVSEVLSKMMKRKGIKHNVLNAKQHQKEAEIIKNAGKKGSVTVATNMAGRGTDIKLDPEVKKNGGLAIIGSERHDSRRIDRQLRGRAGRQGDPGSSQFFISLEDKLMRLFGGEKMAKVMTTLKIPEGEPIQHSMMTSTVERAQKKIEENNFGIRKRLIDYDDVMNQQRTVIYSRRRQALRGERLKGEIFEYIEELAESWYNEYHPDNDFEGFINQCRSTLLSSPDEMKERFESIKVRDFTESVFQSASKFYTRKEQMLGADFMGKLERVAILQTIDEKWKEHLRVMDELKEGIHLRSYGQKDPLLEYKSEAYRLFVELIEDINKEIVSFSFKYFPKMVQHDEQTHQLREISFTDQGLPKFTGVNASSKGIQFSHPSEAPAFITGGVPQAQQQEAYAHGERPQVKTFKRDHDKIGRNDTVKVKYLDGRVIEAKFKKVENDVKNGVAEIVD